jgi:hypothetical protein
MSGQIYLYWQINKGYSITGKENAVKGKFKMASGSHFFKFIF